MDGGAGAQRGGLTVVLLLAITALVAPAAGASDESPTSTTSTAAPTSTTSTTATSTTSSTTAPVEEPDIGADADPADDQDEWLSGEGHEVGATVGTYTATPSTGLGYAESVVIAGSGYAPSSVFGALQCIAGATGLEDCNPSSLVVHGTDGAGNVTFAIPVRRLFLVGGTFVDCADAPGTCVVGAGPSLAASLLDTEPLTFDPSAPIPPDPVITVVPDTDLGLEELVTVSGSGFEPDSDVSIRQCVAGTADVAGDCGQLISEATAADGLGNIDITVVIRRGIRTDNNPLVDCLDAPGCELLAFSFFDPFRIGRAALTFDPSIPTPPPPVVVVTPSTGLADFQLITITATGFAPHDALLVGECAAGKSPFFECGQGRFTEADGSGAVEVTIRARRYTGDPAVDCAVAAGTCVAYAASFDDVFAIGNAPLEFDPNAPPPPTPIVSVVPTTGLRDGDVVSVTGSGFVPGETMGLIQCRNAPTASIVAECGFNTGPQFFTIDATGVLHATFTVRRSLRTSAFGDVDCAQRDDECMLLWAPLQDQFERGSSPLGFAPDPVPPVRGLPATGAPIRRLAAVGGSLCLLGALFLVAVRRRARPAIEWHSEVDTLA